MHNTHTGTSSSPSTPPPAVTAKHLSLDHVGSSPPLSGGRTRQTSGLAACTNFADEEQGAGAEQGEVFYPTFQSTARIGTVLGAVLNLVSTMLGGGVLSLPFALERAGLLLGVPLLLATAAASDFSIYILVSCSRRSGAQSLEAVCARAYGRRARAAALGLMVAVTYLPLIAYVVLMRDLVSPVFELYVLGCDAPAPPAPHFTGGVSGGSGGAYGWDEAVAAADAWWEDGDSALANAVAAEGGGGACMGRGARNALAAAMVALVFPVCLTQRLTGLRAACGVSVASMLVLGAAVVTRAAQCVGGGGGGDPSGTHSAVNLWPHGGVPGALQSVPIFVCAYVCHFNVLPVHGELARPTRRRLHRTVHWTFGLVSAFYLVVGIAGYAYGVCVGRVGDNILKSFDPSDPLVNTGRLFLVITIALSFPLLVIPARDAALRVAAASAPAGGGRGYGSAWRRTRRRRQRNSGGGGDSDGEWEDEALLASQARSDAAVGTGHAYADARANLEVPLLPAEVGPPLNGSSTAVAGVDGVCSDSLSPCKSSAGKGSGADGGGCDEEEPLPDVPLRTRAWIAAAMLSSAYAMATAVTRVSDVWGLLGSSANVAVAFIVPGACYLRIRQRPRHNAWSRARHVAAVALLAAGCAIAVVCTANQVYLIASR